MNKQQRFSAHTLWWDNGLYTMLNSRLGEGDALGTGWFEQQPFTAQYPRVPSTWTTSAPVPFSPFRSVSRPSRVRVNIFHIWACVGISCSIPCLTFLQSGSLVESVDTFEGTTARWSTVTWWPRCRRWSACRPRIVYTWPECKCCFFSHLCFIIGYSFSNRVLFNSRPVYRVTPDH